MARGLRFLFLFHGHENAGSPSPDLRFESFRGAATEGTFAAGIDPAWIKTERYWLPDPELMCDSEPRRHVDQVRERASLHFTHHLASVCLHGDLADTELEADLLVQQTGDHQCHDLLLPAAEGCVTIPQLMDLGV